MSLREDLPDVGTTLHHQCPALLHHNVTLHECHDAIQVIHQIWRKAAGRCCGWLRGLGAQPHSNHARLFPTIFHRDPHWCCHMQHQLNVLATIIRREKQPQLIERLLHKFQRARNKLALFFPVRLVSFQGCQKVFYGSHCNHISWARHGRGEGRTVTASVLSHPAYSAGFVKNQRHRLADEKNSVFACLRYVCRQENCSNMFDLNMFYAMMLLQRPKEKQCSDKCKSRNVSSGNACFQLCNRSATRWAWSHAKTSVEASDV